MTCVGDCKKCYYGEVAETKRLCMTPNQTCNRDRRHCGSYEVVSEKFKCRAQKGFWN